MSNRNVCSLDKSIRSPHLVTETRKKGNGEEGEGVGKNRRGKRKMENCWVKCVTRGGNVRGGEYFIFDRVEELELHGITDKVSIPPSHLPDKSLDSFFSLPSPPIAFSVMMATCARMLRHFIQLVHSTSRTGVNLRKGWIALNDLFRTYFHRKTPPKQSPIRHSNLRTSYLQSKSKDQVFPHTHTHTYNSAYK